MRRKSDNDISIGKKSLNTVKGVQAFGYKVV